VVATRRTGQHPGDRALGAATVLLALGLAWALARLVWALVTPAGPLGQPVALPPARPDAAALSRFDPFDRGAGPAVTVSGLDLTLLGTRADVATGRGSAIIALPDGSQASYAVGDEVMPGIRLAGIGFDNVTLDRGGKREQLFIDMAGTDAGVVPEPAAAPDGPARRLAADLALVPRLAGPQVTGLIMNPKGSGTAFAAAGLQPGDVLVAVAGQPVAGLLGGGDGPAALARRLDSGGVAITVERGGQRLDMRIGAR
jgi:general secretion pathway protein C